MVTKLTLPARPPFSLPAVVGSHGWAQMAPFGREPDGGLQRVERLDSGRVVSLSMQEAAGGVAVEVSESLTAAEEQEVARKVTWMLGLEQDLAPFYAMARGEPKLAGVEAGARGRILRSPTLFEDTVKTILTTNTAWGGTLRMAGALVSQFGDRLVSSQPLAGAADDAAPPQFAFPTPQQVAASDEATLRNETRLGYRAPYVLALARDVDSGALDLEGLKTADLPTPELRRRLLAVKGVGDYAAANLLMILGRHDFLPIDSWALKIVSHEWHGGEPVGRAEVEAAFERWGVWKGLAYWFWDWSYFGEVEAD